MGFVFGLEIFGNEGILLKLLNLLEIVCKFKSKPYLYGMENKLNKVSVISQAILNSSVALRKGANVELVDGKIIYTVQGKKTNGTYKMRCTYKDILFMLNGSDIKKIIAL